MEEHRYQPNGTTKRTPEPLDANTRRNIKAARTRRLNRRLKPFDDLDAEVVSTIKRITPPPEETLTANTARAIIQAQTLRKELLLGKLKAEELDRRVEEKDISEEWEEVKRALGITKGVE
jgi:hypothetical protein